MECPDMTTMVMALIEEAWAQGFFLSGPEFSCCEGQPHPEDTF